MKKQAFRRFAQGLVITLIGLVIVAAIIDPDVGFAQEGGRNPNNTDVGSAESPEILYTDDPLGRVVIPLEEEPPPSPNSQDAEGIGSPPGSAAGSEPTGAESIYASPLVIPGAEFRSDGYNPDSSFFSFGNGYVRGSHIDTCLMAPAYLPDGATVNEIYASVYDNDSNSDVNIWIKLYRLDNYSGAVDQMASMETTSDADAIQVVSDTSIDHATVLYPDFSYYVGACLESEDIRLYSVRIDY